MRQLLRALLGIIGLTLGYAWFLALAYYLLARPDWGPDTSGFRRGIPGFIVSIAGAYYVFMKYAKLWELERFPKS